MPADGGGGHHAHSLPAATRTPALGLPRAVNNAGIGAGAALGAGVAAFDHQGAYQAATLANALTFLPAPQAPRRLAACQTAGRARSALRRIRRAAVIGPREHLSICE
ncbi:hypothetical protein [Streptomyces sp. NPDC088707]|uniref:hypothetical protein n=1 Tax=Streptomyces sp. NPDC088707 TaxID=3365871 RepID=UPI003800F5F2